MTQNFKAMELFPTPIFSADADGVDNAALAARIYQIRDDEQAMGQGRKAGLSNQGGYRTFDIRTDAVFDTLKAALVAIVNTHIIEGKWYNHGKVTTDDICAMWSIINRRGHGNSVHNHPDSWLSGAYYVKVPKDFNKAGAITFRDPNLARTYCRDFYRSVPAEKIALPPIAGRAILFPGWCEHAVLPNETDEDRIVISFNFRKPAAIP